MRAIKQLMWISCVTINVPLFAQQPAATPSSNPQPAESQQAARRRAADLRLPDNVQLVRDVVYGTAKGDDGSIIELKMDVAFPKNAGEKPLPVAIYIHGGGWQSGSKEAGLRPSVVLAAGGYFAATISYRLSDVAKFPAAVHDCKQAVRFIRANAQDLGIDPDKIGVWGHSAGGHLSALLGTSGNSAALDDGEQPVSAAVQCVVDFCGPIDLSRGDGAGSPIANWLGGPASEKSDAARLASPVTHLDAADPPFLVIHGEDDNVVSIRQSAMFEEKLKEVGVPVEFIRVPDTGHAIAQPRLYRRAAEFFDEHLGGHAAGAMIDLLRENAGRPNRPDEPATRPVGGD